MKDLFVNIALNLPLDKLFTYKVPDYYRNTVKVGKRVVVSFGNKILTGIILEIKNECSLKRVKNIKSFLDDETIIRDELINFCIWMSDYYLAPIGEVLFSAVPRNMNIKSEVYYSLAEDYKLKLDVTKFKDELLIEIIKLFEDNDNSKLTRNQVEKRLKSTDLSKNIIKLVDAQILINESLYSKPTKEKIVKLVRRNYEEDELSELLKENKIKSIKQKELLKYLTGKNEFELSEINENVKISSSSLESLVNKELIKIRKVRKIRGHDEIFTEESKKIVLNEEQLVCLDEIKEAVKENKFKTFLLHGITGSGKTEVYINAIDNVLKNQKNAIVLVPEISLTPQLIHRFKIRFGGIIGVIHSKLSDGERLDTFDRILSGDYKIIIGARSALFAPVKDIGIIVVDEEHDSSYKQENSPRYQGRDSAIVRGMINNAVVILGSATPSLESYYNATKGKYELLSLPERATKINPPEINIVDLKKRDKERLQEFLESQSNKIQKDFIDYIDKVRVKFLSKEIIIAIDERLDKKESVILLQNRRGFHSYIECLDCSEVEMCVRCNIALTYHKAFGQLRCHYCGFTKSMITNCTSCNSDRLIPKGAGTERVEEELVKLFPKAVIKRMDSDTMSSKVLYQKILKDFYDKKIDILAGTQIISKGLDFPEVTLVGVINADIGLLNPDFRATENTFQILTQVSGRSGRSVKKGEVYIQTNHSDYHVFEDVKNHDYKNYYEQEIKTREAANYPPFSRIALVETSSIDKKLTEGKIKELYNFVKRTDRKNQLDILPPNPPLFSKLKDRYRYHLLIKSKKEKDPSGKYINKTLKSIKDYAEKNIPSKVKVKIDMDAVDLL